MRFNAYRILIRNPITKGLLGELRTGLGDNVKMNLRKKNYEDEMDGG
jgi:hypothetical protein